MGLLGKACIIALVLAIVYERRMDSVREWLDPAPLDDNATSWEEVFNSQDPDHLTSFRGKRVIVTGGNNGIGLETAKALVSIGVHVIVASRSERRAIPSMKAINAMSRHGGQGTFMEVDLGSMESVRSFVNEFKGKYDRLYGLILNAGFQSLRYEEDKDGIEAHWGINHLGHFELTRNLLDILEATGKETKKNSRIVVLSSYGHQIFLPSEPPDFSQFPYTWETYPKSPFRAFRPYGYSKLANILFANELAARTKARWINVYSLHPGIM